MNPNKVTREVVQRDCAFVITELAREAVRQPSLTGGGLLQRSSSASQRSCWKCASGRGCPFFRRAAQDLGIDGRREPFSFQSSLLPGRSGRPQALRACGGRRVGKADFQPSGGNRAERFSRASSANAFELHRVSSDVLSRAMDQATCQLLDARGSSGYETVWNDRLAVVTSSCFDT